METLKNFEFISPTLPQPADLLLSPDGNFYGIVKQGGDHGFGGIFRYGEAPEITVESPPGTPVSSGEASLDFGQKISGDPAENRQVIISNTGNKPLSLLGFTLTGGGAEDFTLGDSLTGLLAPGETRNVTVSYLARFSGARSVALRVKSDDYDEPDFDFMLRAVTLSPVLNLQQNDSTGPAVLSGQTAVIDFGGTPQGAPVVRRFLVSNKGDGPLRPTKLTVPGGFTVNFQDTEVPAGGSAFFDLALQSGQYGTFGGVVSLESNDPAFPLFIFPVSGIVLSPDITLRDGTLPDSAGIISEQTQPVVFGRTIQGTPLRRVLTIANTGNSALLIRTLTLPAGYMADPGFTLPLTVAPGAEIPLGLSLTGQDSGIRAGSVILLNDDPEEGTYVFPVTGEVFIPAPVPSLPSSATTLNRQTGLREQTLHLSNDTTATVPGFLIIIRGLPPGVTVANASEIRADGAVIVRVSGSMPPYSTMDLLLEYSSAHRFPGDITPLVEIMNLPGTGDADAGAASPGVFAVERLVPLPDGGMLLEFPSRAGVFYEIEYSIDGGSWKTSPAPVQSGGSRCQWIDRGPPRTPSPPSASAKRFYRVRELAP